MSDPVKKYFENQDDMTTSYSYNMNDKHQSNTKWYKDTTFPEKKDKFVQAVKEKFEERSQLGIKKYNTTLERTDLDLLDWIRHAQEEAMDFTLYLEKLMSIVKEKGLHKQ